MMAGSKLMAIAAHPGDALFTMGATVAQHVHDGGAGVFLSLSLGERGAPKNIPVAKYGDMQRVATEKAAAQLGARALFLRYPDAEIPFSDSISLEVCDIIREEKPDVVVTHWSGSWHKDHQNCHLVVRDAIFYAGLGTMQRKLPAFDVKKIYYADNWEDATGFQPDYYLDVTAVCDKWLEVCDLYPMWRGQTGFFRYNDYYSSLAVMRGCLSGYKRAVALMLDPNQKVQRVKTL
jgi:LmbE family N-acetylglucosaminyl deacetylase